MQQIQRLRRSSARIIYDDALAIQRQEKREHLAKLKENANEQIVVRTMLPQLSAFDKYLLYVKEHTTELSCHHGRFYWHTCSGCRRDASHAASYAEYYRAKIQKVLSALETKS